VLESVMLADGLFAPFVVGERWLVALVVRDDLVDGATCVECDGPLEAPSDDLCGAWLVTEVVPLLDEEGPDDLSEPVLSAWATPDPLASAAPTPRVMAPAPSQPRAT
jgi:hypothetical protein